MAELRLGVLTCSDSRSQGIADDTAGRSVIEQAEARGWYVVAYHVCPDDRECIAASLMEMSDIEEADVVVTCGGTGLGPRDVTPEATIDVAERTVPGISEFIRSQWTRDTDRAVLTRGVAVQRGHTLIVNLPGSEEATRESFLIVADQLERATQMIAGKAGT